MKDFLVQNSDDKIYSLKEDYYKKDEAGNFILDDQGNKTIDEDKLVTDLNDIGLTSEQVKTKLAEINANIAAVAKNEESIQSIQDTKKAYEDANKQGADQIEKEITSYTEEKTAAQEEIELNNALMNGTYKFTDGSGNKVNDTEVITYKDANGSEQSITYGELRKRLNTYAAPGEDEKDTEGNQVTASAIGSTGLTAAPAYQDKYKES